MQLILSTAGCWPSSQSAYGNVAPTVHALQAVTLPRWPWYQASLAGLREASFAAANAHAQWCATAAEHDKAVLWLTCQYVMTEMHNVTELLPMPDCTARLHCNTACDLTACDLTAHCDSN